MTRIRFLLLMVCLTMCYTVGCGGGTTADSVPDLEVQENLEADLTEQEGMTEAN